MPELPEVETMARDLRSAIGTTVGGVELFAHGIFLGAPEELVARLAGRRIVGVGRRAKSIVLSFEGNLALLIAPRMTGAPRLDAPRAPRRDRHDHLGILLLRRGRAVARLVYRDPRRFGRLRLVTRTTDGYRDAAGRDPFAAVGPEPLAQGFTARAFADRLRRLGGRRVIKGVLIDQSVVAGVGNIYADEACFAAGLDPRTPTDQVTDAALVAVAGAAQRIMREAIARRGSRIQSYRAPGGGEGMAQRLRAYGRAGLPCLRCGEVMERLQVAGRGTTRCPRCQPATGLRSD